MRNVAALCVSGRSIYKHMPGVVCYDSHRDARTFDFSMPVVAHPPCRLWSRKLRHFAKSDDPDAEKKLGEFCIAAVLRCGGVLENPAGSLLFEMPRTHVAYSYIIEINQSDFGFATKKPTWILIAGVPKDQLPPLPVPKARQSASPVQLMSLSKFQRARTMPDLANWLCQVARLSCPGALALPTSRHECQPARTNHA